MPPAIRVENLSKVYRIGHNQSGAGYSTLRESIVDWVSMPFRHLREGAALGNTEDFWALDDVSFDVEAGEVIGIIGPNGAGKSTLLKVLSRITAPTRGRVSLYGRVASLLEVGTGFHPELTGRENIYLNGSILGMAHSEIRSKFDEIVAFSGIEHFLDTPVKRYSSGMRVRLAFAVAAHLQPEILLVDEVLAVGDASFQRKCLGKMDDVAKSGRTVLFVSHNMGAVQRLCRRGVVLRQGKVVFVGSAENAVDTYLQNLEELAARRLTFEADPKRPINVVEVAVVAENRNDADRLDVGDSLHIELHYEIQEEVQGIHVAVLLSKEGTLLLRSWDIDADHDSFLSRQPGTYVARIPLPRHVLGTGRYSVGFNIGQFHTTSLQREQDCLTFELEDFADDRSHVSSSRDGALLIMPLDWNVRKVA